MLVFNDAQAKDMYELIAKRCGVEFKADIKCAVQDVKVDGKHADVTIVGVLDEWWGVDVQAIIKDLNKQDLNSIHVAIDSPGGKFWRGSQLYQALKAHQQKGVKVTTEGRGLVASAATLPFFASKERSLTEATTVMIHEPYTMMFALGTAAEIRKESERVASSLDNAQGTLEHIYTKAIKSEYQGKIKQWMADETMFNTSESVKYGIAKTIIGDDDSADNKTSDIDNLKNVSNNENELSVFKAFEFDKPTE